jgi:hypothetical protein
MRDFGYQVAAAVTAGLVLYWFTKREAVKAAEAVNPVSTDNVIYKGISSVTDVLDDGASNESSSFGSWLFGVFNPEQAAIERELTSTVTKESLAAAKQTLQ